MVILQNIESFGSQYYASKIAISVQHSNFSDRAKGISTVPNLFFARQIACEKAA